MRRRRIAAFALAGAGLVAGSAAALQALRLGPFAPPLDGRLGGHVSTFDRRPGERIETAAHRRVYLVPGATLSLDLTLDDRARQLTLGHNRIVNDTWEPDLTDWTLVVAQRLARGYLPRDARFERSEPFVFREREAGTVELYRSGALAEVIAAETYAAFNAAGPPGRCAITYYRTRDGGVAFLLVGLH